MKNFFLKLSIAFVFSACYTFATAQIGIVVLQTDFGVKDGAVSAMKGVIMGVDRKLQIFDLTHEIPAYNIWEAALRLEQAASYWPKGTVFVSVVDPGVGSERKSVVLQTKNGYFFISPDNGSLTFIAAHMGIKEIREIDENTNRLPGSEQSYTFHGRDIFAYTAARLAAGKINFKQVGKLLSPKVVSINYQKPVLEKGIIKGTMTVLDTQYGNVWSNITESLLKDAGFKINDKLLVKIYDSDQLIYSGQILFVNTFSSVPKLQPLGYLNSMLNFSVAINMGDFAELYHIKSGPQWLIQISK